MITIPAILIDKQTLESNIAVMQSLCDARGVGLRPHLSAHHLIDVARLQLDAGAIGIACHTLDEAEACAEHGINNILLTRNVIGPENTKRLLDLTLYNRITVIADHPMVVATLADEAKTYDMPVRVMVELTTRQQRGGMQPGEAVELARRIETDEFLHFAGIMLHPSGPDQSSVLHEALDLLHKAGLGVDVVSGGGTHVIQEGNPLDDVTEFRAGRYALNDWHMVMNGWADPDDCALRIATTVISRPSADVALIDCGYYLMGTATINDGYGCIAEYPEATIRSLNSHHACVDFSQCAERPIIGEQLYLIPVDAGFALSQHVTVHMIDEGDMSTGWHTIFGG